MRRTLGVAAAAAALVAANLAVVSAAHAEDPLRETLRLELRTVDSEEIDLGDDGVSLGDQFVFTDRVSEDRDRIGSAHGVCTIVEENGDEITTQCLVTLDLDDGQIAIHGVATFEEDERARFTLAVTGGTDDYRGASGEAHVRERSENRTTVRVSLD